MSPQSAHRPSALKQTNKTHKTGRHRSKGSLASVQKGKINKNNVSKKNHMLSKLERKNQSQQLRKLANEMDATLKKKVGGLNGTPHLVAIIPLNVSFNPQRAIDLLSKCDETNTVTTSSIGAVNISSKRYKARYSFVVLPNESSTLSFAELDLLKVSDTVLFLVSAATVPIDDVGLKKISAIKAQGVPTSVFACMDIQKFRVKDQQEVRQSIQAKIKEHFCDEKVYDLDSNSDALNILRRVSEQKQKILLHRENRAYMLIEDATFISQNEVSGKLKVSGFLRGAPLNVNGLVHIPGLGNFQMEQIEQLDTSSRNSTAGIVLSANPDLQTSLVSENIPDPMDAEQTWPTAEELEESDVNLKETKKMKLIKKVPRGMSDYQAAWIPDVIEADEDSASSVENEDDRENMEYEDENEDEEDDESEYEEETETPENCDKYDETMNFKTEAHDLELLKAASSDKQFPDEIDTPMDIAARIRFQKYRGLESFRTSSWDKKENLPLDYARIFQFQNYDRTRRKILNSDKREEGFMNAGSYVAITLLNVPNSSKICIEKLSTNPLILIGILPHEHKMCIANAKLKQVHSYNHPIKSKERLLIQCGYRRFYVEPIFSEHKNGSKFKFERFFQPDATVVATFFAPIQFAPAPILVFKIMNDNSTRLVATGNLISSDPDRIVLKRIVLSGHPFKVNKRSAVIRFMFFNREDIAYFKPCKLRTRLQKTGHIKEPLGTHGHMKCVFNDQLNSQDTVFLNLYKRIFPKYNYEEYKLGINDIDETLQNEENMNVD